MGDVVQFKKSNLPQASTTQSTASLPENLKPELKDKVAAFTFSRLPREQRIAAILYQALNEAGPIPSSETAEGYDNKNFDAEIREFVDNVSYIMAPYAAKDFVVRYGHLSDGQA